MSTVLFLLLGAVCVCALAYAEDQRNAACRERIRREEADAWCEEFEQQAAALAADCERLRERHATLTELYGEAVRRLLASNYVIVHRNLEWKRRRPDSEQKE